MHKYTLEDIHGKPDAINEQGTAWWVDKDLNKWYSDLDVVNFIVENLDGEADRLIIDKKTKQCLYASKKLEDIGVHLDILRLRKDRENEE